MKYIAVLAYILLLSVLSACVPVTSPVPTRFPATRTATPTAQAAPTATQPSYNWRGATLYLRQSIPASPTQANVYLLQTDQHATLQEAQALAQRFGIKSAVYQSAGELPGTIDYTITDGKQRLTVRSDQYFSYYMDYRKAFTDSYPATQSPDALANIDRFLKSHGFDFTYSVNYPTMWGGYYIEPLTQDGFAIHEEFFKPVGLLISLDETGQVASVQANLIRYKLVGKYDIHSAEEAWQTFLDPHAITGLIEGMHSTSQPIESWQRVYPDNERVTIYGRVSSIKSIVATDSPLTQIDLYIATGNLAGLDKVVQDAYIEATGQFSTQDGIEKFNVESWKISKASEAGFTGTLKRENGKVTLAALEGEHYALPDVPAGVRMPFENAYVIGTQVGNAIEWKTIDDRMTQTGGGGGGGGGLGFYKLNLSGTPVPVIRPTAQVQPTQSPIGQQIVGQRGNLSVTIYKKPDGSQRVQYALTSNDGKNLLGPMLLEGMDLQELQKQNNRPVDIWGTLDHYDQDGNPVVKVERYEIPFPDLRFQIMKGTQKTITINGQSALLFTSQDGKGFVQMVPGGGLDNSPLGLAGDQVLLETLAIPDETFSGYPVLRVFAGSVAVSSKNGQAVEMKITADQPTIMDEPTTASAPPALPLTVTIEKVELVYYLSDPRYAVADPSAGPAYIQPAWRFYGHYSNGDEFEVLIQALKDEFLLPELAPYVHPG